MSEDPDSTKNLPVIQAKEVKKSSSQQELSSTKIKNPELKGSWLGGLFGPRSGSDFRPATSLEWMYKKKERLKGATALFLVLDIVLISVFVFLLSKR